MIRTFIASNAEKAQSKARRALGHTAIVLNIRDLPSGDVEVTAGDEAGARNYRLANPNPITPPVESDARLSPHLSQPVHQPEVSSMSSVPKKETQKPAKFSLFKKRSKEQPEHPQNPSKRDEPIIEDSIFTSSEEGVENYQNEQSPNPLLNTKNNSATDEIPVEEYPAQNADTPPPAAQSVSTQRNYPQITPPLNGLDEKRGARLHESLEQRSTENTLSQLRERLTGQQDPDLVSNDDPAMASIINLLKPHGISDRLLSMILNGARKANVEDDLYRVGLGLSESFNFSPLKSTAAVPMMLVGPTGAGKTSCAAKLSAIALANGDSATMITTDVGRAGALEQFATYSEKLNIECYAAETPEEIATIMKEARPQGAVILDTPGISPYDAGDLAALKSFQTAIGAEPVLVLPASGDVGEYTDWAHAFRAFGVRSCIITKFDATRRVGAGISAAFEGNMTLTYFSETPFISEGLLAASPEFLAYRLTANYPGRIVQK